MASPVASVARWWHRQRGVGPFGRLRPWVIATAIPLACVACTSWFVGQRAMLGSGLAMAQWVSFVSGSRVDLGARLGDVLAEGQKLALLTGGAGFVGRHFAHRLCTTGYHVVLVDSLVSEGALAPGAWPAHLHCPAETLTFIKQDCRDFFAGANGDRPWDLFVHLAAAAHGTGDGQTAAPTMADDVAIDAAAFQWAVDTRGGAKPQPRKMVYLNSDLEVRPVAPPQDGPTPLPDGGAERLSAESAVDPTHGWAKLAGESLARMAHERAGLNVAVYRPMAGYYGEDQDEASPFKALLKRAMAKEETILLWAAGDGATLDVMYIDDMVECLLLEGADEAAEDATPTLLTSGAATSLTDLAARMARQVGYEPPAIGSGPAPGGGGGNGHGHGQASPFPTTKGAASAVRTRQRRCRAHTPLEDGIAIALKYMRGEPLTEIVEARRRSREDADKNAKGDGGAGGAPPGAEGAPVYSSFRCLGGSQTFPGTIMQKTHVFEGWPEANLARNRVCHFENVCWVKDRIVFYEEPQLRAATPDYLWPEAFEASEEGAMLHMGMPATTEWSPAIVQGPLPAGVPINGSVTFLLNENSHSDNFGHILWDDLIPGLQALSVFDFPLDSGLLLSLSGCAKNTPYYQPDAINPYHNKPRKDVCLDNYTVYPPLVLGRPAIDVPRSWDGQTVCMKNVIAGQSSLFSLRTLDVERAPVMRVARDHIVQHLGLAGVPRPAAQSVMVLIKMPGFQGGPSCPTLCEDTQAAVRAIDSSIPVRCFDPAKQGPTEQVRNTLESTVLVAEHGTTAITSLYGHDGLVLLSISDRTIAKDPQINLYSTHYDTYYMAHEDKDTEFAGMLRFVLAKAAANFGIEGGSVLGMAAREQPPIFLTEGEDEGGAILPSPSESKDGADDDKTTCK